MQTRDQIREEDDRRRREADQAEFERQAVEELEACDLYWALADMQENGY